MSRRAGVVECRRLPLAQIWRAPGNGSAEPIPTITEARELAPAIFSTISTSRSFDRPWTPSPMPATEMAGRAPTRLTQNFAAPTT